MNFRSVRMTLVAALCAVLGSRPAAACTGIRILPKDGSVIYARSMEFAGDIHSDVVVVPRGLEYVGSTPGDKPGLHWRSKYAAVGANAFELPIIIDGLTTRGLPWARSICPAMRSTKPLAPRNQPGGNGLGTSQFLLGTCASVAKAMAAVQEVRVVEVVEKHMGLTPPVHFVLHDAAGHCTVLEYVNGTLKVHANPLGVITNSPTFDWHLTNLRNYVNLTVNNVPPIDLGGMKFSGFGQGTGMLGLPGDFTPPSRFVRAVAFSHSALPVDTAYEGVLQAFHILNQFDIPKGSARRRSTATR